MNDMNGLSHKIYLELTPPGPGDSMSDQQRIAAALRAESIPSVRKLTGTLR